MLCLDLAACQRYALYTVMLALLPASSAGPAPTAPEDPCAGGPVRLEVADASGVLHRFEGASAAFGRRLPRHRAAQGAPAAAAGSGDPPFTFHLADASPVSNDHPTAAAGDGSDAGTHGAGSHGDNFAGSSHGARSHGDACAPLRKTYEAGTALLVPRGGCDFATKAMHLAAANVSAMVLVDGQPGSCVVMGFNASSATEEEVDALRGLTAVSVSSVSGAALAGLASNTSSPQLSAWSQPPPVFDSASMALWALAIATVAGGAALAGMDHRAGMRLPTTAAEDGCLRGGSKAPSASSVGGPPFAGHELVTLTAGSALLFVALSSTLLLAMFFFLNQAVYWVLVGLYCMASVQAMTLALTSLLCRALPRRAADAALSLPGLGPTRCVGLAAFFASAAVAVGWCVWQSWPWAWLLQDGMGVALMLMILRSFRVPDARVASLLLCACFCYDVFWVFIQPWLSGGASVMVEVAKGGGSQRLLPMLLLVPHSWPGPHASYALLGFGDVVLPGLLVVFARLYDIERGLKGLWRAYASPAVIAYAAGLLATYAALYYDVGGEEGQPALLYLVPCTLGCVLLLAAARGQLRDMWIAGVGDLTLLEAGTGIGARGIKARCSPGAWGGGSGSSTMGMEDGDDEAEGERAILLPSGGGGL